MNGGIFAETGSYSQLMENNQVGYKNMLWRKYHTMINVFGNWNINKSQYISKKTQ